MKTIRTTHIDTGGHGYLSVSKKDLDMIGIDTNVFTKFSGHNISRMYLEEDCDASYFMNYCEKAQIKVKMRSSHNEKFKITHNYNLELYSYKPAVGDRFSLAKHNYVITELRKNRIIVRNEITGSKYGIPMTNPFDYIMAILPAEDTNS